jgi:hypothetical protein
VLEVIGNLWTYPADVRVITTNGTVKKNGECVMGRGCALEAKQRWPHIALVLGKSIRLHGNIVQYFEGYDVFSFPVKHEWYQKADLQLIAESAQQIQRKLLASSTCVLPRPGCGNGGLRWEDVKPVLEPILDDRFHIITFR